MASSPDATPAPQPRRAATARRRWLLFLASMVPVAALVALLVWGSASSGGRPGGLIVNAEPGELTVTARPSPPFSLTPLGTAPAISKEALRGKVVMLDFWSSWCPPCRQEAPVLAQVYGEYADAPVEFVGVAIWDVESEVLRHISRYQVPYPNAIDDRGLVAVDFGVRGLPEKFFLDRQGNVVRKYIGPMEPKVLRTILDQLLAPQ